jgi:hypothetical protein
MPHRKLSTFHDYKVESSTLVPPCDTPSLAPLEAVDTPCDVESSLPPCAFSLLPWACTFPMARTKQATPIKRTPSETYAQSNGNGTAKRVRRGSFVETVEQKIEQAAEMAARDPKEQHEAGLGALVICIGGIYASL